MNDGISRFVPAAHAGIDSLVAFAAFLGVLLVLTFALRRPVMRARLSAAERPNR